MARTERRRAGTRLVPRAVREEQMLEVAGEVFAERGFHAASMDEIAERADISKPMLYAYFGSKDGLYGSYMERVGARLLAAMDAASTPRSSRAPQVLCLDDGVPRLRRASTARAGRCSSASSSRAAADPRPATSPACAPPSRAA